MPSAPPSMPAAQALAKKGTKLRRQEVEAALARVFLPSTGKRKAEAEPDDRCTGAMYVFPHLKPPLHVHY